MSMTLSIGDDRDDLRISDRDVDVDVDVDDDDEPDRAEPDQRSTDSDDSDDDSDGDDDRSPDELKAEIRRLRASLAKSNSTGLRRRNQLKELKAAQQAQDAQNDDDTDDDDDEVEKPKQRPTDDGRLDARQVQRRIEKAKREARAEADRAHTRDLIDTRAESAMARAGADEKAIRLLKRELDYDELELDPKTRTVDGMEEEIDRLRGEFPNLFRSGKTARRRINGGDDRESGKHQRALSPSEVQARQLRGL